MPTIPRQRVIHSATAFMHKPFVCASAEALPFPASRFDGCWSYAVLEHVEHAEKALEEMRRVLKSGGLLILAPAWQCRPWAGQDYSWKSYPELPLLDRFKKAMIPLRDSVAFRALQIVPCRLLHLLDVAVRRDPVHSMDPFDVILWFHSRGDLVLSHPDWWQKFTVRTGPLVIQVNHA